METAQHILWAKMATLYCGDIFRIKAILRTEVEGSSMFYLVADKFEDFEREDVHIR